MARAGAIQIGDGSEYPTRIGRLGDLVISAASGEYFELAKQNRMFVASQQAGAVFGTALTATVVGSSGALDFVNGGISVAPGFAVTLQGLGGANVAQGIMSIIWAEIPV